MNGALAGFRIDGVTKLIRLHGERGCGQILAELLQYLRFVRCERLRAYAKTTMLVAESDGPFLSPSVRAWSEAFLEDYLGESCRVLTWSDVFTVLSDFEAWHAGFPFLPDPAIDSCGDISWGFLINLDADELQIYINRHARFAWRDMAAQAPFCAIAIAGARKLSESDAAALNEVLHFHSYSDGLDPVLPTSNALSQTFPGPGCWTSQFRSANNRIRLLLRREELEVEVGLLGELKPDDSRCGAFLRSVIQPEVLGLGRAIYGSEITLTEAARIARRMAELPFAPEDRGLPLLDLGLRHSSGFALPLGRAYFDELKACMVAAGLSQQGWRFLIRQSAPVLRCLLGHFRLSAYRVREFSYFINLLASALQCEALTLQRCEPALRGVQRILERGARRSGPVREENARIYLRCIMRAAMSVEQEANLTHEAQQVSDFLHDQLAPLPGRQSWQSLCRRSDRWHREALTQISPERDLHWTALLPNWQCSGYEVLELDSGARLLQEGLEQKHCVGSYADACASGTCRIFSVRLRGKRLATIELRRELGGKWSLGQVRSKANGAVKDAALLRLARKLVAAYVSAAGRGADLANGQALSDAAAHCGPLAGLKQAGR